MKAKKLGVLGGMGPAATSLFFDKIIKNTIAFQDQDHIDIVISNHATLPDRTEAILQNKGDFFLETLQADLQLFEHASVNNIAIPCNTSHYFFDDIQKMTHINIINMVQMTMKTIQSIYGDGSKIAILATDGTINSKVYEHECHKHNLIPHIPNARTQKEVMEMIYQIKGDSPVDPEQLEKIIEQKLVDENCTAVILGCTELSCIPIRKELASRIVDPLEVLVHTSILLSGKESKLTHLPNEGATQIVSN